MAKVFVAALDVDYPEGQPLNELRTLIKIYRHNNPELWKPSEDLERISLGQFTKIQEFNMAELGQMPANAPLAALVFQSPWDAGDQGLANLIDLVSRLITRINVVDFGPNMLMPEATFYPLMLSRAGAVNTATFLALKGVCTDFFEKFATSERKFGLHVTILTIAEMPCDWQVQDHLGEVHSRITFNGSKSKVLYMELGDDVTRRIRPDDDEEDERERSFYLVEPTLVALQSHTQIVRINTLEFAHDSGLFLDEILDNKLINTVTQELVLVLSAVVFPDMPDPSGERPSTSADSRRRGRGARGAGDEGSSSSHPAWIRAFEALYNRYRQLKRLRIIFADIHVFQIENKKSFESMVGYLNELDWNLGRLDGSRPGLLSAANHLHCQKRGLKVEVCLHQILQSFHMLDAPDDMCFGSQQVPTPWKVGNRVNWSGPTRGGSRYIVSHEDQFKQNNVGRMYFDCNIQVAECYHPSQLATDGRVPIAYRRTFGYENGAKTYQKVDVRTLTALNQRELGSYAVKHYDLEQQRACIFTEQQWRRADPFWFLADAPIRPNTIARALFPRDKGHEFTDLSDPIP